MRHWNSNQLAVNKTEFHIGWVNYCDDAGNWRPIDCEIVDTGSGFEVTKAPFSCSFPKYSTGVAEMYSTNRWDIWKKEKITADPFGMSLEALDAVSVEGQIFDINGDGRMDAVIYPQAFPHWDADLIYYVHHGKAPGLKKLVGYHSDPGSHEPNFYIEYSHDAEISSRTIPDGLTRAQHRANCHSRLNTPLPVNADKGFYIRKDGEAQKRGLGIKDFKLWDSNQFAIDGRKEITIQADIRKHGQGYKLTKYIPSSFFADCVFPCYTDATSTFYPDPDPETNTVDGIVRHDFGAGSGVAWNVLIASAGTQAIDGGAFQDVFDIFSDSGTDTWSRLDRTIALFDISSIPSGDTISSVIESWYGKLKDDNISIAPDINIFSSSPASDTGLVAGDFDSLGTSPWATAIAYDDWSITGYNDFVYNSTGISAVKSAVSGDGILRTGARNANYDADGVAPTWSASALSRMQAYFADEAGTTKNPKVVVVHSPFNGFPFFFGGGHY